MLFRSRIDDFGVGTYIRNLVEKLAAREPENDYFLLGHSDAGEVLGSLPGNFRILHWNRPAGLRAEIQLTQLIQSTGADLLHIPYLLPALMVPCRYLMTVHDLENLQLRANGTTFRLGDFAVIKREYANPPQDKMRFNGKEVIGLGISMEKGGNKIGRAHV